MQLTKAFLQNVLRAKIDAALKDLHPDLEIRLASGKFTADAADYKLEIKVKGAKSITQKKRENKAQSAVEVMGIFASINGLDADKVAEFPCPQGRRWKLHSYNSKAPVRPWGLIEVTTGAKVVADPALAKQLFAKG